MSQSQEEAGSQLPVLVNVYTEEMKLEAFDLFMKGLSAPKVAHQISNRFNIVCKTSTISKWKDEGQWVIRRDEVRSQSYSLLEKEEKKRLVAMNREHARTYQAITERALGDFENLHFDEAKDAVRALHTGIQGEREVISGLINLQFVEDVVNVLREEVLDEETLKRIAFRLKRLLSDNLRD